MGRVKWGGQKEAAQGVTRNSVCCGHGQVNPSRDSIGDPWEEGKGGESMSPKIWETQEAGRGRRGEVD